MDRIAHALLGRVADADGDVVTGHRVVAIRPRATGLTVHTEDGSEHEAPSVACNMAPADMLALLDGADVPDAYVERVEAIQPSGNAHQIKLGLGRVRAARAFAGLVALGYFALLLLPLAGVPRGVWAGLIGLPHPPRKPGHPSRRSPRPGRAGVGSRPERRVSHRMERPDWFICWSCS